MSKNILKIMHRDFKIIQKQYLLALFALTSALTLIEIFGNREFNGLKLLWVSFFYFILTQANYHISKFENVSLGMPIKRSDNVIAQFLSYFIISSASGFIITGLNRLLFNMGLLTNIHLITWEMGVSNFVSNIALIGIFLPIFYKVGDYVKALWISLICFAAFLVFAEIIEKKNLDIIPDVCTSPFFYVSILIIAYFSSMLLAIKFYNKREF